MRATPSSRLPCAEEGGRLPPLRRLLLAGVRLYRRRLSGRGPLARVRCTFERCESCAALGERALLEAPSTLEAARRILRRLGRCRSLSLYRLEGGALGGGPGYDAVLHAAHPPAALAALDAALARDGEGPQARQAVAVAGARLALDMDLEATLPRLAGGVLPTLLVRDAEALRIALRRRLRSRALAAAFALALGAALLLRGAAFAAVGPLLLAAAAALAAIATRRLAARLADLETLAAIEGPISSPAKLISSSA